MFTFSCRSILIKLVNFGTVENISKFLLFAGIFFYENSSSAKLYLHNTVALANFFNCMISLVSIF